MVKAKVRVEAYRVARNCQVLPNTLYASDNSAFTASRGGLRFLPPKSKRNCSAAA
jgi:hypothetical protein